MSDTTWFVLAVAGMLSMWGLGVITGLVIASFKRERARRRAREYLASLTRVRRTKIDEYMQ